MRSGLFRLMWSLLLAGSLFAGTARAVELVPGDYGAPPNLAGGLAAAQDEERSLTPFVIAFTPRAAGKLRFGEASRALDSTRLDFGIGSGAILGIDRLGLGRPPQQEDGDDHMLVGGGFEYNGVAFGGAYGRSLMFGRPADLVAAGVGFGAFSASFGYAWRDGQDEAPFDMLMLSTDLMALPWLAFESDLAVGESDGTDAIAVGRLGIRLNF